MTRLHKRRQSVSVVLSGLTAFSVLPYAYGQDLNFEAPAVEQKKDTAVPQQLGPLSNVTIGGAIDWRIIHTNGSKRPAAFIHVNEFVVSANVGDHIAVSAEQLLLTSEVGSVVGQDHGFVTVSLVQLPFLPDGMLLKLGRFRGKFGLDAQVDSPANIFPSQALRSNGFVTDIGMGVDFARGDFEAIVEVFNGADYKSASGQRQGIMVDKLPVQVRFIYQPASNVKLGLSGLTGETWDNQVDPNILDMGMLGSRLETSRTIERQRVAFDVGVKTPYADFYGEGIYGRDKGRLAQPTNKKNTDAQGALGRTDVPLFKIGDQTRSKVAFQYDSWHDASYTGRVAFLSTAFSVQSDDGWTARIGGSASDVIFKKHKPSNIPEAPWSATTQLLVTF